jgi:hypothetical protein
MSTYLGKVTLVDVEPSFSMSTYLGKITLVDVEASFSMSTYLGKVTLVDVEAIQDGRLGLVLSHSPGFL